MSATSRLFSRIPVLLAAALLSSCASRQPAPAPQSVPSGPSFHAAGPPPACHSESYILIDARTGASLAAGNADARRQVASTQKLLMALTVIDQGNLGKRVVITPADKAIGSGGVTLGGVRAGDTATRAQLLMASLVKSANDMVSAVSRDAGGTMPRFMQLMNGKAQQLGMRSSHFCNPHGMPGSQYSTARDMATCARAAYHNGFIRGAAMRKNFAFTTGSGRTVSVKTTNKLLGRMPEANGLKTGFTNAAGPCLISSAARNGRAVILVQLHSRSGDTRWSDAEKMLEWGLRRIGG